MKIILFSLLMLASSPMLLAAEADTPQPQANPEAVVTSGRARFTVLTPQMIRIQFSTRQQFEDRATFAVINRQLPVPEFTTREEDGYLYIETSALTLRYKMGSIISPALKAPTNLSITIHEPQTTIWYPGKEDALNLKGTKRTLDTASGDNQRGELEDGIISRAGWAIIDESPRTKRGDGSTTFAFDKSVDGIPWLDSPVDPNAYDWYFMGYGHDYKRAIGDYIKIAGRQPLPPRYVLGYWYSKYQRYSQQDFINIVNDIKQNDIPLDVMIFDMDWHLDGWTGWTWNKNLIPNPEGLIRWMHNQGIKVSLNLHPADGVASHEDHFQEIKADMNMTGDRVPWMLEDSTFYRSMFSHIIHEREQQGVDFWWIDWQQNLTSNYTPGLSETFWCNHVFFNDMRLNRPERRPFIFHRWGGLGSHRYPIGFSGDTYSTFGSLAFQPYFTATASNVCFGYWGHDLGGHLQIAPTDPELMLRWLQFGVFSPIFRTHGASQEGNERRIWMYPNFPQLLKCVDLRYQLMPYIYTAARQAYDTGISICRPLYYDWPEENEAYRQQGEYMFGDDILASPVVTPVEGNGKAFHKTWLPSGNNWYDVCRHRLLNGGQTISDEYTQEEIPYFLRAGAIIPCNPKMKNLKTLSDELLLMIAPGADGQTTLYEDEGDTQDYINGAYTTTRMSYDASTSTLTIAPTEGSFEGMPIERAWQVSFLGQQKPYTVYVNGKPYTEWTWDEQTGNVTVIVPTTPCSSQVIVRLESNPSGIADIISGNRKGSGCNSYDLNGHSVGNQQKRGILIKRSMQPNGTVNTHKYISR